MALQTASEVGSYGWLIVTFIAFLSAIGIGSLLAALLNRRNTVTDRRRDLNISVAGKQIEADSAFLQSVLKRLETLEKEQKEMSEKLLNQSVANAELRKENEHLKETNSRQESEIKLLREKERALTHEVQGLKSELGQTNTHLESVNKQFETLKYDFEKFTQNQK